MRAIAAAAIGIAASIHRGYGAADELLLFDGSAFLRFLRFFVVTDNALQGANIEGRTLFASCHQRDRTKRHRASPVRDGLVAPFR
jgi:hypothetical protein